MLHMWSTCAGNLCRKTSTLKKNNGASDDSLQRFAVANQDKRSDKAPQSRRWRIPSRERHEIISKAVPRDG